MPERTIAPPVHSIAKVSITEADYYSLANGTPVFLINAGKHDIIRVELIFKSGRWYENVSGLSFFSAKMLFEGTIDNTAGEIASFFDSRGAYIQIDPGADHVHISIYALKKNLKEVLSFFINCLTTSVMPEYELNNLKEIYTQQIALNNQKNSYLASKEFRKLLYGADHPYGGSMEADKINEFIDQKAVTGYYKGDLLSGLEIIVSGNLDYKVIQSMEVFSGLSIRVIAPREVPVHSSRTEKHIEKEGSLQTSIRLGRRIISKGHPDYYGLAVLNEILGGYFGSRLMKNIREDKGYTYGVYSTIVHHIHDSYWLIGADVRKEFREQAIQEIHREMDRLMLDPASDEELITVKNYMQGSFLASLETSFSLADKFRKIHFFGLGYDYYKGYIDTINKIDASTIQKLARKYLDRSLFRYALVG